MLSHLRTPYGQRLAAQDAIEAPYEGVPPWARASLLQWIVPFLGAHGSTQTSTSNILLSIERTLRLQLNWSSREDSAWNSLLAQANADDDLFLALVELCLKNLGWGYWWDRHHSAAVSLLRILMESGSVWEVVSDGSDDTETTYLLQRRTTPETQAAVAEVISSGGNVASHLAAAWANTFGRDPNPTVGYSEAVKAVEAAAQPVVLPQDSLATLGKIIAAMRTKPEKWKCALTEQVGADFGGNQTGAKLQPVEVVVTMLDLLWKNQTDRHGVSGTPKPVNQVQAESAAHLALTLIHLFKSGAVSLA